MNGLVRLLKLGVLAHGALFRERRRGLAILIYHRIGGGGGSEIDIPTDLFARQMAYLRDNYALVSMDDLLHDPLPFGGSIDRVVVTFDDGCRETYSEAFPMLKRYRVPVTIYLATRYVDEGLPFDFGGYRRSTARPRPLEWPQVREMLDSGLVTIGSHTHSHLDLSREPSAMVRGELELSRRIIEDRLGMTPLHFAYPWGIVTPAVKTIVVQFFKTAVAGGTGRNIPGAMDLHALRRIPIQRSDGFGFFRLKLKSYLDGEEIVRTLRARLMGARASDSDPAIIREA